MEPIKNFSVFARSSEFWPASSFKAKESFILTNSNLETGPGSGGSSTPGFSIKLEKQRRPRISVRGYRVAHKVRSLVDDLFHEIQNSMLQVTTTHRDLHDDKSHTCRQPRSKRKRDIYNAHFGFQNPEARINDEANIGAWNLGDRMTKLLARTRLRKLWAGCQYSPSHIGLSMSAAESSER